METSCKMRKNIYVIIGICTVLFVTTAVLYSDKNTETKENCILCNTRERKSNGNIYLICLNNGEVMNLSLNSDCVFERNDKGTCLVLKKHICNNSFLIIAKDDQRKEVALYFKRRTHENEDSKCDLCEECRKRVDSDCSWDLLYLPKDNRLIKVPEENGVEIIYEECLIRIYEEE